MRSEFTPGAARALDAAATWTSSDESNELRLPEILLGLLAEPECRAALILARFHIDEETVRRRFPQLAPLPPDESSTSRRLSVDWQNSLAAAEDLLVEYPRPLELATEHLLLGIVASDNPISRWLADCGLYPDALEAEVHRASGHEPGPLPLDLDASDLEPANEVTQWVRVATVDELDALSDEEAADPQPIATLRILDAAANRAGEGLRVVEDYLRFQLDDRHLTRLCKEIRHELTAALSVYTTAERHAARETQADVGTSVSVPEELDRTDLDAVLSANFKRIEQSLRSLEEYSKTIAPPTAARIEQLRYRTYTLERAVDITGRSLERLATACLYVLIDGSPSPGEFQAKAQTLVDAGVSVLQLRDKHLADRELLHRARILRQITQDTQTLFIMNDRPDLAVLSGADGVHVGQEELSVKDARRILGARGLIGVSTHSLAQAQQAVLDGADYIGVGPTFPSGTKRFAHFTGTELLRQVAEEIRLPAFAIGGITPEHLAEVLESGFTRVAVSGAVALADDPAIAVQDFLRRLG